jgi:hypothetical protein
MAAIHGKDFRRRQHLRFETHIMAAVWTVLIPSNKKVLAVPTIRTSLSHGFDLSKIRGRPSSQPLPGMRHRKKLMPS